MPSLRQLRLAKGLSQKRLATLTGLRQATLSALERGTSNPHAATMALLAQALGCTPEQIGQSIRQDHPQGSREAIASSWPFLRDLDGDLRRGLTEELIATWTHTSTALEGNTIPQGDTLFVLREGLTVSGHSLREHQELQGHAQAIAFMDRLLSRSLPLTVTACHECHRLVQTGVHTDILAPIGRWKVERNGTQAITTDGRSAWHEYAAPEHVPALMSQWIELASVLPKHQRSSEAAALEAYTQLHLGFAAIHPYADGNGRMARLLANLPVLRAGHPPLLIAKKSRRSYLQLMGDFSLARGAPRPGQRLVSGHRSVERLRAFFSGQWRQSLAIVRRFHTRQSQRRPRA